MTKNKIIQDSMFAEMRNKSLFKKVNSFAMDYLATALDEMELI